MIVHQSHAGAIIGRQGVKIKELREQTSSNLKIFQDVCPYSNDRVLLITALQDKIPNVIRTIVEFIKEVYYFYELNYRCQKNCCKILILF